MRARVAYLGHEFGLVGGDGEQGLHAGLEIVERPAGLGCALAHRRQHDLLDIGRRADRMEADAFGHLARHPAHH